MKHFVHISKHPEITNLLMLTQISDISGQRVTISTSMYLLKLCYQTDKQKDPESFLLIFMAYIHLRLNFRGRKDSVASVIPR